MTHQSHGRGAATKTGSRWPAPPNPGIAATAVGTALLVWWATGPWGAGITIDAIAYAAIAEQMRDHQQIGYWLEPSSSTWPPLFPGFLAALSSILDVSVLDAARILNAAAAAATVLVTGTLATKLLRSAWLRAVAVVAAAVAQPIVFSAVKALSETLFNLWVLLALLALLGLPGRRPALRSAAAMGFVVLAFATRYSGFVLIPVGAIVLGVLPRGDTLRARLRRAFVFTVPLAAAAAALLAWNVARAGSAFGPRWQPRVSFWAHAADAIASIGSWFLPAGDARWARLTFGVLALAVAAFSASLPWRTEGPGADRVRDRQPLPAVALAPALLVFVGSYGCYMVWARTTSGFDPLNSRLMLPVFLPTLLLILAALEHWAATLAEGRARLVVLAIPLLLVGRTSLDGLRDLRITHDAGSVYANEVTHEFLARPLIRALPRDCALITNDPWLLKLAGVEAQLSPESKREVAIPQSMELSALAPLVASQPVCLVWIETGSTVFFTPAQLADTVGLHEIAGDGVTTVYRLSPRA